MKDPRSYSAGGLIGLEEDPWGRLVASWADGVCLAGVVPVRPFPWTSRNDFVVLLDEAGHEVACISALETLPAEVRATLDGVLRRLEFVPVIERILRWSHPYPPCVWTVETNRGPVTIAIDSDDEVRKLGEHEALVSDTSGLRYRIPDIRRLDSVSRSRLRRLL